MSDLKKIKVYDLNTYFQKELEVESFRYEKVAIFEGPKGVVVAEHEAVHMLENALSDTIVLPVNPISEPGRIWLVPTMELRTKIEELQDAPFTEMTMDEFFDRRNYNPRCQSNYRTLMNHLRDIGFDLHGYFAPERPTLNDQIHAASSNIHSEPKQPVQSRDTGPDR